MDITATILFCDTIRTDFTDGKAIPNIVRPITSIEPIAIPGNYTFSLYCSIERLSTNEEHKLDLKIYDPNDTVIYSIKELPIDSKAGLKIDGDYYANIEIAVDARNVVINSTGVIRASLCVDGKEVASTEMKVLKS